jgi:hypothetical protein
VPVISGGTRDEARLFVGLFFDLAGQPVTPQRYTELLAEAFGGAAGQVAQYPLSDYDSPSLAWAAVITDRVWALRTMEQHQLLAAHVPTYAFEFADREAPPNVPFPANFPPGAHHNSGDVDADCGGADERGEQAIGRKGYYFAKSGALLKPSQGVNKFESRDSPLPSLTESFGFSGSPLIACSAPVGCFMMKSIVQLTCCHSSVLMLFSW